MSEQDVNKLERLRFSIETYLNAELADELANPASVIIKPWCDTTIVAAIQYEILGRNLEGIEISWPANWWQALKAQFAPVWFLRRWPVVYEKRHITVKEYYPKVALPDKDPHITLDVHEFKAKGG